MGTEPINPADVVLIDEKSSREVLIHAVVELTRRIEQLETAKLLQQTLIDSLHARLQAFESIFGKGGAVQ
jgi:hypothetical protein